MLTTTPLHPMTSVVIGNESYEEYEKRVFRIFKDFIGEMACDYKLELHQIEELFQQAMYWYEYER